MILTPERVPFGFRVWRRNWTVFKKFAMAEVGPLFVEPLVVLGAMGLGLGTYVSLGGEVSYVEFIGPGIIGGYSLFARSLNARTAPIPAWPYEACTRP